MFNLDDAISDLVESEEFFQDFKEQLKLMKDPDKKAKFMESLLGYRLSKLKTTEPIADDRFRPIQINYTVTGTETTINNGTAPEDS